MNLNFDPNRKFRISTQQVEHIWTSYDWYEIKLDDREEVPSAELQVKGVLSDLLNPESGIIDGNTLKELIFPTGARPHFPNFDVFISHSHNDEEPAEHLADILRSEYEKTPFLDKYVWSSADELLRNIDNAYCKRENSRNYVYEKRNFSTSHVHTMLSMAIMEMIAKCKSFIFIESSESLDYNQLKDYGETTLSPWLYQGLQYVRMLSTAIRRSLNEQREFSTGGQLRIRYGADLSDFTVLNADNIAHYFRN